MACAMNLVRLKDVQIDRVNVITVLSVADTATGDGRWAGSAYSANYWC